MDDLLLQGNHGFSAILELLLHTSAMEGTILRLLQDHMVANGGDINEIEKRTNEYYGTVREKITEILLSNYGETELGNLIKRN